MIELLSVSSGLRERFALNLRLMKQNTEMSPIVSVDKWSSGFDESRSRGQSNMTTSNSQARQKRVIPLHVG